MQEFRFNDLSTPASKLETLPYETIQLSKHILDSCVDRLILIDEDTIGETWGRSHFAVELPGKWECSWIAVDGAAPVGFVIASVKADSVHVHRIAIAASVRGGGVGRVLLSRVAECAAERKIPRVTLRVSALNDGAVRFYRRLGFHDDGPDPELLSLSIPIDVLLRACNEPVG